MSDKTWDKAASQVSLIGEIGERTFARIQAFRLMDDPFMRVCLDGNIAGVQLMLRIMLNMPDLIVLSVRTQYELQSLHGTRSLRLDVLAVDSTGRLFNLEIQRKEVDPERGRLHAAMLDGSALEAGAPFSRLPEGWVIFIMERDPFGRQQPLYHFVRVDLESGLPLNDGSHIVYVNGALRGDQTELAKVLHDLFCTDPDEMYFEELAQVVRYYKQTGEGVRKMSSVVEEIREEGRTEARAEERRAFALQLLQLGQFTLERIAEMTRLSLDELAVLVEKNAAEAPEGAKGSSCGC